MTEHMDSYARSLVCISQSKFRGRSRPSHFEMQLACLHTKKGIRLFFLPSNVCLKGTLEVADFFFLSFSFFWGGMLAESNFLKCEF